MKATQLKSLVVVVVTRAVTLHEFEETVIDICVTRWTGSCGQWSAAL